MTGAPRSIVHPGPRAGERVARAACALSRNRIRLRAGLPFDEAVYRALREIGSESAYVTLSGLAVRSLHYVIPAASPDDDHAAWYSDTFAPDGEAAIETAGLFVGRREGAPFLHCHGIFRTADGRAMGHLRPSETVLAADAWAEALCLDGAIMEVCRDGETNFPLFRPVRLGDPSGAGGARALLATVRPNEDIRSAVAALCREAGFRSATIHGIGSLVGAEFADGRQVASYATEVLVHRGALGPDAEDAALNIALVGLDGRLSEGRLCRDNPVCVTFELLVVENA